mgnify:CR=1 FL=1
MKPTIKSQVTMMDLLAPLDCSLQVLVSAYPRMTLLQLKVFTAIASGHSTVTQIATATGRHKKGICWAVDALSLGTKANNTTGGLNLIQSSTSRQGRPCKVFTLTPSGLQLIASLSSAIGKAQLPRSPKTGLFSWLPWFGGGS